MNHTIRLLSIDLGGASALAREAFSLSSTELAALTSLAGSGAGALELVVLADEARFELYTTEASRQQVFRHVLASLADRAPREARVGIRTSELTGVAAAWHLMQRTVGSRVRSGVRMLGALNVAVERARAAGTLGPELESLFVHAADAGWRIQGETALGDAESPLEEREQDLYEADRIIDEELVSWQATRTRAGVKQSIAAVRLDPSHYSVVEPGSSVRMTAPHLPNVASLLEARRRSG